MRFATVLGAAVIALLMQASLPAQASLIGTGSNTVSVLFFLGAPAVPSPPYTSPAPSENEDYVNSMGMTTNSPPPTIPVHFVEGALDLSTIDVGDTQITITNMAPPTMPFCSVTTTPCPDVFTGFAFTFSAGVDITGVSVDPASATGFLPTGSGLQLATPRDILVNVAGDAPNINDQLIIDVSTAAIIPSVPEPATVTLFAVGLLSFMLPRLRRNRPVSPSATAS